MVFSANAPTTEIYGKNVTFRSVNVNLVNFPTHRIRNTHFVELGLPEYENVKYITVLDSENHVPGQHINKIDKHILKIIRVDFDVDMFRREGRQMIPMVEDDHYYFYYILIDLYPFSEIYRNKSQFILRTNPGLIFTQTHMPEHGYEFIPLNEFARPDSARSATDLHNIIKNFINHIFYITDREFVNYRQFMKIEKDIIKTLLKSSKKVLKKDIRKKEGFIEKVEKDLEETEDRWGFKRQHLESMRQSKARGMNKLEKLKGRSSSSSSSSSREYNVPEERITDEMINKLKRGLLVGGE